MRGKSFKALTSLAAAAMLLFSSAGVMAQADTAPAPAQPSAEGASVGAQDVLYDRMDNPGSVQTAVPSQNFETLQNDSDSEAADDFVLPGGIAGWTIKTVEVIGVYNKVAAPSANVRFYANSASNLPGALLYDAVVATPLISGTTALNLNPPLVLYAGGHYWVSVQANLDFTGEGRQWYWRGRTVQSDNPSAWRNPGDAYGTGCTAFQPRAATCVIDPSEPDMVFRLSGIVNTSVVYLPLIHK